MKDASAPITEKLTKSFLVRFTQTDHDRLLAQARALPQEPVELIRGAALAEISRLEFAQAQREIARLAAAGIDLKALVDYAIGRKLAEDAQINLPGVFPAAPRS